MPTKFTSEKISKVISIGDLRDSTIGILILDLLTLNSLNIINSKSHRNANPKTQIRKVHTRTNSPSISESSLFGIFIGVEETFRLESVGIGIDGFVACNTVDVGEDEGTFGNTVTFVDVVFDGDVRNTGGNDGTPSKNITFII